MNEEILLDDEQIYWLSLLRDFGTQDTQGVQEKFEPTNSNDNANSSNNNNIHSYTYLDLIEMETEENNERNCSIEGVNPTASTKKSTWLVGNDIDEDWQGRSKFEPEVNTEQCSLTYSDAILCKTENNDDEKSSLPIRPSDRNWKRDSEDEFSAFHSRFLSQSLRTKNSLYRDLYNVDSLNQDKSINNFSTSDGPVSMWNDGYTEKIYNKMKNEMVFHSLESVNSGDVEEKEATTCVTASGDNSTFVPMVTEEEYELDRSARLANQKSKVPDFAVEIPQQPSNTKWYDYIAHYFTAMKQRLISQEDLDHNKQHEDKTSSFLELLNGAEVLRDSVLQQLNERLYLHSLLSVVQEVTNNTLDRTEALSEQILSLSPAVSGPEGKYFGAMSSVAKDWEQLLMRYSMATLNWQQRQMLKETRDIHLRFATSLPNASSLSIKERLELLLVSKIQKEVAFGHVEIEKEISEPQALALISKEEREEFFPTIHQLLQAESQVINDYETMEKVFDGSASDEEPNQARLKVLLVNYFTPPTFELGTQCALCETPFSLTCFRHHCRYCGRSVCHVHSAQKRRLLRFGIIPRVRVCDVCVNKIDERYYYDDLLWKDGRIMAYFSQELIPYFPKFSHSDESSKQVQSSWEVSNSTNASSIALHNTQKALLYATTTLAQYSQNLLSVSAPPSEADCAPHLQNFWQGLDAAFSQESTKESLLFKTLSLVRNTLHLDTLFPRLGSQVLQLALYFFCLLNDALYGSNPTLPVQIHHANSSPGLYDHPLNEAIKYASLALRIIYTHSAYEMQRLARLQGLDLLYTNLDIDYADQYIEPATHMSIFKYVISTVLRHKPTYAVFATTLRVATSTSGNPTDPRFIFRKPEVVIVVRGGQEGEDNFLSKSFCGNRDYEISGTVLFPPPPDMLLAYMTGEYLPLELALSRLQNCDERFNEKNTFWVSTPVAVQALWILQQIGPSLTRLLSKHVRAGNDRDDGTYEVTTVGHGLGGSIAAVVSTLLHTALPSISKNVVVKSVGYGSLACLSPVVGKDVEPERSCKILTIVLQDDIYVRLSCHRSKNSFMKDFRSYLHSLFLPLFQSEKNLSNSRFVNDSCDSQINHDNILSAAGIAGDESLLWHFCLQLLVSMPHSYYSRFSSLLSAASFRTISENAIVDTRNISQNSHGGGDSGEEDDDIVLIEHQDTQPAPTHVLSLPGSTVLHLICSAGQWYATSHPTNVHDDDFSSFFHTLLTSHGISDHTPRSLFSALLETRAQLNHNTHATHSTPPPHWPSLFASSQCQCCRNPLPWPSSDRTHNCADETDGWCGRYHCFHCGQVVCGACSSSRIPLPRFGLLFTKRICDTCALSGEYANV